MDMNNVILAIFLSCLFIQMSTHRISSKMDSILTELKAIKDGKGNGT